ncbi:DUF3375 domain-containing protein [Spirosoma pollinicola]|uniref:DUF3375 domain-containing protein n=1 Tax=Spirosoma pollinicola TaxID=2057025 RepID=A0A2K8Z0N5_9BACT|nr:DUF3375 domain-containing protein [Spirosoma pollinicola]AUD03421.1 hypothetical protein CWM47_17225 [Spirosoma pollinicola]
MSEKAPTFDYYWVKNLYERHPVLAAFRKRADGFSVMVSFLHEAFEQRRQSRYIEPDLINKLTDFLLAIDVLDSSAKTPRDYLEEWTKDGMLRRFYDDLLHDEPFYELTPDAVLVLRWLQELDQNEFVGTESRLRVLFDLLEQLAYRSSSDKASRIEQLRREIQEREAEIDRIERGELDVWDATRIRENFQLVQETARRLLADFRQVEQNFRDIDRGLRDEILTTPLSKGNLLDKLFSTIDERIWGRDQGKSFRSFWELLMNQAKQDEFDMLLNEVVQLSALRELAPALRDLERLKFDLVEAGGNVNRANDLIIKSLRRLIETNFFREHKHILQKIESVLELAVRVKAQPPKNRDLMHIDGKPQLDFFMNRRLFHPSVVATIRSETVDAGEQDADISALLTDDDVSLEQLETNIGQLLRHRPQVSLAAVLSEFPPQKGLAEIVGYLSLASQSEVQNKATVSEDIQDEIAYDTDEGLRMLQLPRIIFIR